SSSVVYFLALGPFPPRRSSDLYVRTGIDLIETHVFLGHQCAGAVVIQLGARIGPVLEVQVGKSEPGLGLLPDIGGAHLRARLQVDRKSTRLNSSHVKISYAVFC